MLDSQNKERRRQEISIHFSHRNLHDYMLYIILFIHPSIIQLHTYITSPSSPFFKQLKPNLFK